MMAKNTHTLYLCYFGLREPLVQTQVLPYLREINKLEDIKISLLTFESNYKEKWTNEQIEAERKKLAGEGIDWYCLPYHKSPSAPATIYDLLNGARFVINLARKEKIDFLHARAHIPLLIALIAKKITKSEIVFDIRGLMAEEYVDAGIWQNNSELFRLTKYIERKGIEKASEIVVLTARLYDYLVENNLKKSESIEVIPCCVDLTRIDRTKKVEKRSRFELIYAGSITGLYLLREMGNFFLEIKKYEPDAFFRILTVSPPQIVREIFKELSIAENDYAVSKVAPDEVPEYLKRAHLGISFRKPTFSQIAASPTKIPEYLACGLPVVSNYGIGDTDHLLENEKVGFCLKDFTQNEVSRVAKEIHKLSNENEITERCVKAARKWFDLATVGGKNYRNVYNRLLTDKTLYICYFGLRESLVQTQVLPYLREINKDGTKVSLLTFEPDFKEKWTAEQIENEKKKLAGKNIDWHCLAYHKRPSVPATLYDILIGAFYASRLIRREKIGVLHARVHTPAVMGAIARKLTRRKPKLLFDIRGFFPEEYTDAGVWKENGWLYKSVKKIEKWLFNESDGFVVLTEKAREILFPESAKTGFDKFHRPVEVIPCCVDLKRFEAASDTSRMKMRQKYNLENRRVIVYVGSFGGWYMTDEMADFLGAARTQDASTFALILTQSDAETVSALLQKRGFTKNDFLIKKVAPDEIPLYLSASDIAISFIKACYSKQASSPTKIAEYLACGLPVISNSGVGDLDALIKGEEVGIVLGGFDEDNYLKALNKTNDLIEQGDLPEHCRRVSKKYFDLRKIGGEGYRRLYRKLLQR